MKIQLISDTHGRFTNIIWNRNADIVLAAGDISENIEKAISFLKTAPCPVFYIAGNHEFYNSDIKETLKKLRDLCDETNGKINFLEKDSFEIDDIRLIGTTLWSNYDNFDPLLIDSSEGFINDFFNIKAGSYNLDTEWIEDLKTLNNTYEKTRRSLFLQGGINKEIIEKIYNDRLKVFKDKKIDVLDENFLINRFSASLVYLFNKESVYWLEEELIDPFKGKTIVMTHHSPSKLPLSLSNFVVNAYGKSLNPFINNKLSLPKIGTYTNSLEGLITRNNISHWVHGHFHNQMKYQIGETQVHCNPTGYRINNSSYTGYSSYTFDTNKSGSFLKNNIFHFNYIIKGIMNYILFLKNTNSLNVVFDNYHYLKAIVEEINVNITPLLSLHGEYNKFINLKNPLLEMINKEVSQDFDLEFIYVLTEELFDYLNTLLKILKNLS